MAAVPAADRAANHVPAGLQTLLLRVGAVDGMVPVIAAHLVFVLPYVFLSLGDPWRAWDRRQPVSPRPSVHRLPG